jgi:hypothetical protein
MRRRLWLAGLVLGLWGAQPAWAQSAKTWGPPPGPIHNQVINTGAFPMPAASSPTWSNPFHALANLFSSPGSPNKKPPLKPGKKKPRKNVQPVPR